MKKITVCIIGSGAIEAEASKALSAYNGVVVIGHLSRSHLKDTVTSFLLKEESSDIPNESLSHILSKTRKNKRENY